MCLKAMVKMVKDGKQRKIQPLFSLKSRRVEGGDQKLISSIVPGSECIPASVVSQSGAEDAMGSLLDKYV